MSRSHTFARLLAEALRSGRLYVLPGTSRPPATLITGRLDTGVILAPVRIVVPGRFRDLKRSPPLVHCDENWMKTGADWHNGPPMCWVLPDEWRDAMSWRGKPVRAIMAEGREWVMKGSACLINRHFSAHLDGLTDWPSAWAFWSHYDEGIKEYRQERRSQHHTGNSQRRRS